MRPSAAAEMAIGGVLRRRDFAVAERWLRGAAAGGDRALPAADLRAAGRGDAERGVGGGSGGRRPPARDAARLARPQPRGRDRDVLPPRQPDRGRGGGGRGLAAGAGARRLGVHPAGGDGRQRRALPRPPGEPRRRGRWLPRPARSAAGPLRSAAGVPGGAVGGSAVEPDRGAARGRPARRGVGDVRRVAVGGPVGSDGAALRRADGRPRPPARRQRRLAPQPRADPAQRRAEHDAALPARGDARAAAAPRHRRGDGGAGEGRARPHRAPPAPDARADRAVARADRPARARTPSARPRISATTSRCWSRGTGCTSCRRPPSTSPRPSGASATKPRRTPPPTARCGPPSARARITCCCRRCASSRPCSPAASTPRPAPIHRGMDSAGR